MSRLDDHVTAVRNRMALILFIATLGWLSAVFAAVALLGVLADKILLLHPPRPELWVYAGIASVLIGAGFYALHKRPRPSEAAVPIDHKLGLKEKISTALFVRPSSDPFAQAAVCDAEEAARSVVLNMQQHFPLSFPRIGYATIVLAAAVMLSLKIDPLNFFNRREKELERAATQDKVDSATKQVQLALAKVEAIPPSLANQEAIKLAKAELQATLSQPVNDPAKAQRTAVKALQDVNEAIKEQIKSSAKYAEAQNQAKLFRSMQKPTEGQGPVSDAHRAVAEGKFSDAVDELEKAVENFDKMDKADQAKTAQQMQQLAQQLQQMSNNPQQQQKNQQQLQQMGGMNQQQAQQAQQLMQQAAQGDKQAQQQLQQMAQQAMQQAQNNPQMQQQIQQMMQQMQAQANAQQQAQQLAQAAQQMAQAMQQAAQPPQQGAQNQQQQQQQQQMGQAMNQMQQQLQQMQAAAQDAKQIAAAQAAAQAAAAQAQQAMGGNGQGNKPGGAGGGNWDPNANIAGPNQNPNQQWNGQQGFAGPNPGGIGAGDRNYKEHLSVKQEVSPSQDDEKGRILASNYIKDNNPLKGSSTESLKEVADRAQNEQTDEIDQERISRQAQKAVKEYFNSMSKDQ